MKLVPKVFSLLRIGEIEEPGKCQPFSICSWTLVFLGILLETVCSSSRSQLKIFSYGSSF